MINKLDILVFTRAPHAYEPSRILEEAEKLDFKAKIISYPRLDFIIAKKGIDILYEGERMPSTSMVIFRAAGGVDGCYVPQRDYLMSYFREHGVKILNETTYLRWPRLDKITQHFEFQKAKIPFIESINYGGNSRLRKYVRDYPRIAKKNLSSRGRDVVKLKSVWGVRKLLKNYWARNLLIQPFLYAGEDLRIIVIGGKVIGAMKRTARKGKYLTNYSVGGIITNYDIFSDLNALKIAENTAKHFLLDYVGVDLMKDEKGCWRVLEINRSCQFQGFESATGINVPKNIVDFLVT